MRAPKVSAIATIAIAKNQDLSFLGCLQCWLLLILTWAWLHDPSFARALLLIISANVACPRLWFPPWLFVLFPLKASHSLIYAVSPACSSNSGERSSLFYFLMPFPFPPSFPQEMWKSVRFKSFRLLPSFSQPPPSLTAPSPGIIWSPTLVLTSMSPLLSEYLHGGSLSFQLGPCVHPHPPQNHLDILIRTQAWDPPLLRGISKGWTFLSGFHLPHLQYASKWPCFLLPPHSFLSLPKALPAPRGKQSTDSLFPFMLLSTHVYTWPKLWSHT